MSQNIGCNSHNPPYGSCQSKRQASYWLLSTEKCCLGSFHGSIRSTIHLIKHILGDFLPKEEVGTKHKKGAEDRDTELYLLSQLARGYI